MRLENSELRAFCSVIEVNGFGRAAEALHLTQSAVSQTIANLEIKLGIALIERGKQLKLTEAGKRLFDYAISVLRDERQVLSDIDRIKRGDTAALSLAVSSTINRFYAPQLVSLYARQWPNTHLKFAELPSRSIIAAVLSGQADLGLGPFQKQMSAFHCVPLFAETRHLVVSRNHPLHASIVGGNKRSFRKTAIITSALDDPEMRPAFQRIRDHFATTWEISSLSLRIHLIDQGFGVGYLNNKLLQEHPVCREFDVVDEVAFGSIDRQVGLYYREGHRLEEGARRFIELCSSFWKVLPDSP